MAGITTTSTVNQEFQTYFTDYLLQHVIQLTVYQQFGDKKPFPKASGAKTIRFFKKNAADDTQVQTLAEGTSPSSATYRQLTLTPVDVTLSQLGQVAAVTDILTLTDKLNILKETIGTMTEDCALKTDRVIRDEIVATNISDNFNRTKVYAGGAANWAALAALGQSSGSLTGADVLNQRTSLVLNRAQRIDGDYIMITPPNISRDLMNDAKWVNLSQYSKPDMLLNAEAGMFYGCRVVEHTNPFKEDGGSGAEGTFASAPSSANAIFVTMFTGKGAYGIPIMAGQSPLGPKIYSVDTPDHADPLNQQTLTGWKSYWGVKLYHSDWLVCFRSKSQYGV